MLSSLFCVDMHLHHDVLIALCPFRCSDFDLFNANDMRGNWFAVTCMVEVVSSSCQCCGKLWFALTEECFTGAILCSYPLASRSRWSTCPPNTQAVDGVCINSFFMRLLVGLENYLFDFSLCSSGQCVSNVKIHSYHKINQPCMPASQWPKMTKTHGRPAAAHEYCVGIRNEEWLRFDSTQSTSSFIPCGFPRGEFFIF